MQSLRDLSLKWKLLIPFLFLSFVGTTALVLIAFRSQNALIENQERQVLQNDYRYFQKLVEEKTDFLLSLAEMISARSDVREGLANRDRKALLEQLSPTYTLLKAKFGIDKFHFHIPPTTSFLRLHSPERFGDPLGSSRRTIVETEKTGIGVGGIESGVTGLGIRGVVPVRWEGKQMGTLELGFSLGRPLLMAFKRQHNCDLALFLPKGKGSIQKPSLLCSTYTSDLIPSKERFDQAFSMDQIVFNYRLIGDENLALILGPVKDFSGNSIAVVTIGINRKPTLALIEKYKSAMIIVEGIALLFAFSFVGWISILFIRPISDIVRGAREIAEGDRMNLPIWANDEIGTLTKALNQMVLYLESSRQRMKDYADNLEREVKNRTKELRDSERMYRTLVENVPLIVYRIKADRSPIFINPFFKDALGVPPRDVLNDPDRLNALIHPSDRVRVLQNFNESVRNGKEFHEEYRLQPPDGPSLFVIDHAIPITDSSGGIRRIDGIIVDISDRKRLQEKILQAEELKTLGEISSRLAHEIRNPLTSLGGLARRLLRLIDEKDPNRSTMEIIVHQVERLEKILEMILTYLEPFTVNPALEEPNVVISRVVQSIEPEAKHREVSLKLDLATDLPPIPIDRDMFSKALTILLKNALYRIGKTRDMTLSLRSAEEETFVRIDIIHPVFHLSDDDIEHFFYPFVTDSVETALKDLPIAKVIIHKHGGIVEVKREGEEKLKVTIYLPKALEED